MRAIVDFFRSLLLLELIKGFALTGRYLFARKITIEYPEERAPQSNRFRGMHVLIRRERMGAAKCFYVREGGTNFYVHQYAGRDAIAEHALRKCSRLDGTLSDRDENDFPDGRKVDILAGKRERIAVELHRFL